MCACVCVCVIVCMCVAVVDHFLLFCWGEGETWGVGSWLMDLQMDSVFSTKTESD